MSERSKRQSLTDPASGGFIRDSVWSTATTGVTLGFQMLEIMVLSRALSQGDLGIYFLIIAFPELIQGLFDLRLQEVMIKYLIGFLKDDDAKRISALVKASWLVSVASGVLVVLIVAGTATFAASALKAGEHAGLMILYAFGLFFTALQGRSGAIIRALGRFDVNFGIALTSAIIRFGLVLAPLAIGGGLSMLIGARVIALLLTTGIIGYASLRLLRTRVAVDFSTPLSALGPVWRELALFSFHLNVASIAKSISQRADIMLVGALLNPNAVAAYKVIGQLGRSVYLVSDPLITASYPRFVSIAASARFAELWALARKASLAVGLVLLPILITTGLFHAALVGAFAGARYVEHSWLLPVFMCSFAPAIVLFWTHPFLLSINKAHLSAYANVVGRLVGTTLLLLLLLWFSLAGAAVASGIPACLTVGIGFWYAWRFTRPGAVGGPVPQLASDDRPRIA